MDNREQNSANKNRASGMLDMNKSSSAKDLQQIGRGVKDKII